MTCQKCGKAAERDARFCANCGNELPRSERVEVPGEDGLYYCHKHKKETTRVTCGRCERPLCTRCTIVGPAGVRCRDCARNKTPFRLRGALHTAGSSVGSLDTRRVWYLAAWFAVIGFIRDLFGGHGRF